MRLYKGMMIEQIEQIEREWNKKKEGSWQLSRVQEEGLEGRRKKREIMRRSKDQ